MALPLTEPPTNMKKFVIYTATLLIFLSVLYNSVYIEDLQEHKSALSDKEFNAAKYVIDELFPELQEQPSLEAGIFLDSLSADFKGFSARHGKKLGISEDYNFLIHGTARVINILEEDVLLELNNPRVQRIRLATDFIFGNTLRDASGLVDIGTYQNTMDFNEISIALNQQVRDQVLPPFKKEVSEGAVVTFKGGVKVSVRSKELPSLRVIPFMLEIE